jgi:adenosine deaminase
MTNHDPLDLPDFLRLIPKVELHCHLFGTIRHPTMLALCARNNVDIPRDEIDGYYIRGEKPKGVLHIFRQLEKLIVRTPEDIYDITLDYLREAHSHTIRYTEFFWNPTGVLAQRTMTYGQARDAIVRAIHDAERDLGIVGRLIVAIDRQDTPEAAYEMVSLAVAHPAPEVIGLGIDYSEIDRPPEFFWKAYRLAKQRGLHATAHAGEFGMHWRNVETAIDLLGVERIDHGYTILDNPDLVRRCAESGIVFTVVPTNSFYLRTLPRDEWAARHPIRFMPGQGLKVHPNTDDPTFHNVTPTGAWQMMVKDFGFSLDDLRGFLANGLTGAWIDDTTRRAWQRDWTAEFDTLRGRLQA